MARALDMGSGPSQSRRSVAIYPAVSMPYRGAATAGLAASVFGGMAGALLAHYLGTIDPNRSDVEEMVFVLIWVIVGGPATVFGPIVGVIVLTVVSEMLLREMAVDQARPLIYGTIGRRLAGEPGGD